MYILLLRHGTIRTFLKVDNKPINAHFLPIVRNRIRIGKNG